MKKLLLLVALFVATVSNAQKGALLVGGNIAFTSEKIGDLKSTNFEFAPRVGYQFADNWAAGVEGSIINVDTDGLQKSERYKAGAYFRYTTALTDTFSFYADLAGGYQTNSINDAKGMYASFTPNLSINVKNGIALNFSVGGINYDNIDGHNDARQERFGFDFAKTFSVGISKNFKL
jgi:hypothetical protein